MAYGRQAFHAAVLASPLIGGLAGYRYFGWLGAIVYAIASLPVLGALLVATMICGAWIKYRCDQKRVSSLPLSELQEIIKRPEHADFEHAYSVLHSHGVNLEPIRQGLVAMLLSADPRERQLSFGRLQAIHPRLRDGYDPYHEDMPEQLHAWVTTQLEKLR